MTRCFIKILGPPNQSGPRYFAPSAPPPPFAGLGINNDGVPCSDCSETKIFALNLSLLKTKEVVDILFIQIRTILMKLLYRAMLPKKHFHNKRLFNILCFINFYHLKRQSSPWPEVGFVYIVNKTYS